MFNTLRRWLGSREDDFDASAVMAWAQARGHAPRRDAGHARFALEGRFGQQCWQLEYGAPRRSYFTGQELRMWSDLGLPQGLQLLLMSRSLQDGLETAGFDLSARPGSSGIDAASLEEVRWVASYPKVALPSHPALRPHFGMVASAPDAAQRWLHGRLGERAAEFGAELLHSAPFLLMTLRGQIHLRLQASALPVELLEETVDLFRVAVARAQEVLLDWAEDDDGVWASTTSITWHPDDPLVDLGPDK